MHHDKNIFFTQFDVVLKHGESELRAGTHGGQRVFRGMAAAAKVCNIGGCLLYTSDAADD